LASVKTTTRELGRKVATAAEWYVKAVAQGLASSRNQLGNCYEEGEGVTQDFKIAAAWYAKAAAQGDADAPARRDACLARAAAAASR
jgi:TPR repeat protein